MNTHEMISCLEHVREMFPRFNDSPIAAKYWHQLIGKYTKPQFLAAFQRHLSDSEHPPTIAKMKAVLSGMYAREDGPTAVWDRDYQIIDFCMDMLGCDLVSDEIKSVIGHPQSVKWSALVNHKGWVTGFRRAKKQLWDFACQRWTESGPPPYRFWKGPEERAWDLIGAPHFIKGDKNITPARDSALGRVPYERVDGYTPPASPLTEIAL